MIIQGEVLCSGGSTAVTVISVDQNALQLQDMLHFQYSLSLFCFCYHSLMCNHQPKFQQDYICSRSKGIRGNVGNSHRNRDKADKSEMTKTSSQKKKILECIYHHR